MGKTVKKPRSERCGEDSIQLCIQRIKDGMSRHTACKKYGVPVSTIRYRMSGNWKNKCTRGPRSVLTSAEEIKIVQWLTNMQERGFPVSKATLKFKVNEFLVQDSRKTPFKDGQPGRKWFQSFMRRNPGFSLRTPECVTTASARVSEGDIRGWFTMTKDWIEKNDVAEILLDASRVWNGDETSFYLHPKTREVIAQKGSRNVYEVEQAAGKQNVTVMFTFSAAGEVVTPQVILPGQRVRKEIAEGFPPDWLIGVSERGWMTAHNFAEYIRKDFHPFLVKENVQFPVIFFVDGHVSHKALEVADLCQSLGIILIALYPNTTHITQPCDVAVFKPLKDKWRQVVEEWRLAHYGEVFTLPHFGKALAKAVEEGIKPQSIINGFRVCGLHPFNPDNVDYSKCLAQKANAPAEVEEAEPIDIATHDVDMDTTFLDSELNPPTLENVVLPRDSQAIPPLSTSTPPSKHFSVPVDDIIQAVDMIGCQTMKKIQGDVSSLTREERIIRFFFLKFVQPYINATSNFSPEQSFGLVNRSAGYEITGQSQDHYCVPDTEIMMFGNEMRDAPHDNDSGGPLHSNLIEEGTLIFECVLSDNISPPLDQHELSETIVNETQNILDNNFVEEYEGDNNVQEPFYDTSDQNHTGPLSSTSSNNNRINTISNGITEGLVCQSIVNTKEQHEERSVLQDVCNRQALKQISISDVLKLPPIPRRSGVHRHYTKKFHPVLTARERLEEIRKKEDDKMKLEAEKKNKAKERELAKIERENAKRINAEERKRKKEENAEERKRKKEENATKKGAKKSKLV